MTERRFGAFVVGCVFCIGLVIASLSAAPQNSSPATERTVGQIAQERVDVATRGYELEVQRWKTMRWVKSGKDQPDGILLPDAAVKWLRRRAVAALDLPDAAKRNALLEDYVRQLKQEVSITEQLVKSGDRSPEELLSVQYRELDGELLLAKAPEKR